MRVVISIYFRHYYTLNSVYELAKRKKVDVAILHLGAGVFPYLIKNLRVTMNGEEAIETTNLLNPTVVIPIHYEG